MSRQASTFVLMLIMWAPAGQSLAELPPDETVVLIIREDPEEPESSPKFSIKLSLKAQSMVGQSVGWAINRATIRRFVDEVPDAEWQDTGAVVLTSDGLWWVEHANPQTPDLSEFANPPHIVGNADAKTGNVNDLDYDIEGVLYTPPPEGPPYAVTIGLNHYFIQQGGLTAEDTGIDEPVEADDDDIIGGGS